MWARPRRHVIISDMALFAVKALLAPGFVVGASLTARRFGPRVGGLVGGLPVVAGPILLVYALQHGPGFAAHAAAGTLLGLVSLTGFVVVYGRLAGRAPWIGAMLAGWGAFALGTLAFSTFAAPAGLALALAFAGFIVGVRLLPSARGGLPRLTVMPAWDLPLRACCALALVLALTAAAGWLGPQLSGLLAPFPVIATVLATFTHAQRGAQETLRLLRGMLAGYVAFALFCFALAVSLPPLGVAGAFALATTVALLTQAMLIVRAQREPAARAYAAGRATGSITAGPPAASSISTAVPTRPEALPAAQIERW
jgi:hypothetical protein